MKIKILSLIALIGLYSCSAISEKATEKAAKENAYLSSFLKTPSSNLVKTFGKPTQTLAENKDLYPLVGIDIYHYILLTKTTKEGERTC